jgi:hypothetical protein
MLPRKHIVAATFCAAIADGWSARSPHVAVDVMLDGVGAVMGMVHRLALELPTPVWSFFCYALRWPAFSQR